MRNEAGGLRRLLQVVRTGGEIDLYSVILVLLWIAGVFCQKLSPPLRVAAWSGYVDQSPS